MIVAYETNWRKHKIKEGIPIAETFLVTRLVITNPDIPLNNV